MYYNEQVAYLPCLLETTTVPAPYRSDIITQLNHVQPAVVSNCVSFAMCSKPERSGFALSSAATCNSSCVAFSPRSSRVLSLMYLTKTLQTFFLKTMASCSTTLWHIDWKVATSSFNVLWKASHGCKFSGFRSLLSNSMGDTLSCEGKQQN